MTCLLKIVVMNVVWKAFLGLLLVLRICKSRDKNNNCSLGAVVAIPDLLWHCNVSAAWCVWCYFTSLQACFSSQVCNSPNLYPFLLRGYSLWPRKLIWWIQLVALLLKCCSIGNVNSGHRGYFGWICSLRASVVLAWVYNGCSLCTLLTFSWSVVPVNTVDEFHSHKTHYHFFDSGPHTSKLNPFTRKETVWIDVAVATRSVSFNPVSTRRKLQLPPPSSMQKEFPSNRRLAPLSASQPFMQAGQDELLEFSPTVRKSGRPLEEETNRLFIKSIILTVFSTFTVLHATSFPLCSASATYLEVLLQSTVRRQASMSFCVLLRPSVIKIRRGGQLAATRLSIQLKFVVWQPTLDVCEGN